MPSAARPVPPLDRPRPAPRRRVAIGAALAVLAGLAVYAGLPAPQPVATPATTLPPLPDPPAMPLPPPIAPVAPAPAPAAILRGSIPGLSVNATFATRGGGGSILVTRPDATRVIVAAGTDVVPGTRLTGVAIDRATFTTGATRFWMPLQSEAAARADPGPATVMVAAAPLPPPVVPAAASAAELRDSVAYQAALTPGADGVYKGYTVRALPPLFAKAGLKPGDIITGINGRAFDGPTEIAMLAHEAAISSTVVFRIRRGGQSQELQVQPR